MWRLVILPTARASTASDTSVSTGSGGLLREAIAGSMGQYTSACRVQHGILDQGSDCHMMQKFNNCRAPSKTAVHAESVALSRLTHIYTALTRQPAPKFVVLVIVMVTHGFGGYGCNLALAGCQEMDRHNRSDLGLIYNASKPALPY